VTPALRIEALRRDHRVEAFSCGDAELDRFFIRYALQAQSAETSRTYVGLDGETVIGFYTLVASEVAHANAPERVTKGTARHPIPLLLLARLAAHRDWQGQQIGAGLLRDAMQRAVQAATILGIRALAVHAKDDRAVAFYEHFGFMPSPVSPRHMYLLLKDVRRMLSGG
jgi:GNAT superfamily N-acetyltransferase